MQQAGDIGDHRFDVGAEFQRFIERLLEIDGVHAQVFGQYEVVIIKDGVEFFRQFGRILQVGYAYAATGNLVLIGGTDAAGRGPDGGPARPICSRAVRISAWCKRCSVTRISRRPRSTHT